MLDHAPQNLRRLMTDQGLSLREVAQRAQLDERTVRKLLRGTHRPHVRTWHHVATGLNVAADELFLDPAQLLYRRFDRQTNPAVDEVVAERPDLFAGWSEADFAELHSRVGCGGPLTREGALAAAEQLNRKRALHDKLDLLLESTHAELVANILEAMHRDVVVES